jgi:hypothetical protein
MITIAIIAEWADPPPADDQYGHIFFFQFTIEDAIDAGCIKGLECMIFSNLVQLTHMWDRRFAAGHHPGFDIQFVSGAGAALLQLNAMRMDELIDAFRDQHRLDLAFGNGVGPTEDRGHFTRYEIMVSMVAAHNLRASLQSITYAYVRYWNPMGFGLICASYGSPKGDCIMRVPGMLINSWRIIEMKSVISDSPNRWRVVVHTYSTDPALHGKKYRAGLFHAIAALHMVDGENHPQTLQNHAAARGHVNQRVKPRSDTEAGMFIWPLSWLVDHAIVCLHPAHSRSYGPGVGVSAPRAVHTWYGDAPVVSMKQAITCDYAPLNPSIPLHKPYMNIAFNNARSLYGRPTPAAMGEAQNQLRPITIHDNTPGLLGLCKWPSMAVGPVAQIQRDAYILCFQRMLDL